jgi:hypothetical protein
MRHVFIEKSIKTLAPSRNFSHVVPSQPPPKKTRFCEEVAASSGKTLREVTEITGLSAQTQARYLRKLKTEGTFVPTTPNISGPRNSTAKVNDEWLATLTKQCEEEPDLYDKERASKLSQITNDASVLTNDL